MMDMKKEKDLEGLAPSKSHDIHQNPVQNHDDVFGEITESGPNYRNVCFFVSSFHFSFFFSIKCTIGSELTTL